MLFEHTSHSDYIPLVNLLGVYFQIRDDYMNLQSTEVILLQPTVLFLLSLTFSRLSMQAIKASQKTSPKESSLSPSFTVFEQIHQTDKSSVSLSVILLTVYSLLVKTYYRNAPQLQP